MSPAALALVDKHRTQGHTLMILPRPIALLRARLPSIGIPHLLATEPKMTPKWALRKSWIGTPCFQGGKVTRLQDWLQGTQ